MGWGVARVYPLTMTTGTSLTTYVDTGRSYAQVYVTIPGVSSFCVTATCNFFVQASADGTNFYRVAYPPANSSTSGSNDFQIANTVSNRIVPIPTGFHFYKVEASNSMTGAIGFNLVCADT